MYFAEMFKKYRDKVYPARVAFVSFLRDPQKPGQMTPALEKHGITPLCFPMHGRQPDLTKVDALLGLLASESAFFQEQASLLAQDIEASGMDRVLQDLNHHTQRDEIDVLVAHLNTLRDLAFARVQDRQAFLGLFGKLRHLARLINKNKLETAIAPFLAEVAEDEKQPLSNAFFEKLLQESERWEIQLEADIAS